MATWVSDSNMYLSQIQNIDSPSSVLTDYETFVGDFTSRFMLYAIGLAGLVFVIIIIISGFNMLTSMGEPAKIQSAGKSLTNGFIGLLLVVATYFIMQIIQAVFGLTIL